MKMRVNRGQEFVVGGYTIGTRTFDAVIFGYYEGDRLLYAGRTRSGFTPASREQLFRKLRPLEIADCPFANLPEARSGRWGEGLTRAKMAACRWLNSLVRDATTQACEVGCKLTNGTRVLTTRIAFTT